MDPSVVLEQLRELEVRVALGHCGASAAEQPADAIRGLLRAAREGGAPEIELACSLSDPRLQRVFVSLCSRYGLKPYRRPRQRQTTMMVKGPRSFLHDVFWPLFEDAAVTVQTPLDLWVEQLMARFNSELSTPSGPTPS